MGKLNRLQQLSGWVVFLISAFVYFLTVERTGSLWDCGEFILGAQKLQVVHPPGAPLFLLIGRIFTWFAEIFSDNPEDIAFSVNLMSGICSAFTAAFVAWVSIHLGKLALYGRHEPEDDDLGGDIALFGGGLAAGLATAFCSSIWFSAVEGEVYAMSTFFTALTLWSMVRWYVLPDTPRADRWLLFTIFAMGLSVGVHLLSLLTAPAMALFYYFKKYEKTSILGMGVASIAGLVLIVFVQSVVIVGIPNLWKVFEIPMVNYLRLPVHSGIIPALLIVAAIIVFGLSYADKHGKALMQQIFVGIALLVIAFSTIGVVVIRANAVPPVNMNSPSDVTSLLPYINREQYGERDLLMGPSFKASPYDQVIKDRYGLVGDRYEYTNYKVTPLYRDNETTLFPRMSDGTQGRPDIYKQWMGLSPDQSLPSNRPNFGDNVGFFINYQLGWMYWRYFMWNFSGRQNGTQGFYSWDKSAGNWISGIPFIDNARLGPQGELPEAEKNNEARNVYFMLPFLFGLIGLFWHAYRRGNEFIGLLAMFIITGIGIIIYTNQPPNEPRERDYVLVGSFFTYCIWLGMAVPAIFGLLRDRAKLSSPISAVVASLLVLTAPVLMGSQNWDDHDRSEHKGSRDYAANFLNSVDENAIIFTYGDNDTYPLWYAQEVENIRTDVRVVNLSLIAVDWYIDLLRRKVNDSDIIKMDHLSADAMRGFLRNRVYYYNPQNQDGDPRRDRPTTLEDFLTFVGEDHELRGSGGRPIETYYNSANVTLNADPQRAVQSGFAPAGDTSILSRIPININNKFIQKDELAILDIIQSNMYERPIYWAVTCQPSKLMGLQDYTRLEGLALRLTPVKSNSDNNYGIVGSGSVDADKIYDLVMDNTADLPGEGWKWGNFDQVDTYVNDSYRPATQSMQLVMRRAAFDFLRRGENEKAMQLIDKYFESFPDKNFPFFIQTIYMLSIYWQAEDWDRAAPVMEQLAKNLKDRLEFYDSLPDNILRSSYEQDYRLSVQFSQSLLQEAERSKDAALKQRIDDIYGDYAQTLMAPATQPGGLRN